MIAFLAAAILTQVGPTVGFPWAGGVEAPVAISADIIAIVKVDAERSRSTRQELVPPKAGDPPTVLGNSLWVRSADVEAVSGKGGVALVCNQWGAGVCNPRKRRLENHRERRKFVSP